MNPPQCDGIDDIHFLIAAQRVFTCTEAARCQPPTEDAQTHEEKRAELEKQGWGIEVYHRALKQCCGAERAQVRKAVAILKHLLLGL